MSRRHPHIVHVEEVEASSLRAGERFDGQRRKVGAAAGARQLGVSHVVVPPGKAAWPAHFHAGNEEAIFVLAGRGTMRLGEERVSVRAGDLVALPVEPVAHQLVNDSDEELVYLCVSTQHPCDVGVYPDSGKIGVFGGAAPGADASARFVSGFYRAEDTVPYYDGEA